MEKIGDYVLREGEQDKLTLENGLKYIISNKKFYSPKREAENVVGYSIKFREVEKGDKHKHFEIFRG